MHRKKRSYECDDELIVAYPPRSKKLSSMSACLMFRTFVHMTVTIFSVSVEGDIRLQPSSEDSLSKGGNAFLSNFPVA